jgi:hypothetical protein
MRFGFCHLGLISVSRFRIPHVPEEIVAVNLEKVIRDENPILHGFVN